MTVTLLRMADASVEPKTLPVATKAVAGYIGGDTPHVWTAAEWDRFTGLKKLPIYVATGIANGTQDGWDAVKRLYQLNVPKGTAVVYDLETNVWPEAVSNFGAVIRWCGYHTWPYGSKNYIFKNPQLAGYWVADYTGEPHLATMKGKWTVATQYADPALSKVPWDLSVIRYWAYVRKLKAW